MRERQIVIEGMAGAYRRAGKKEKGRILEQVVEATGYLRRYAARLLRGQGRRIYRPGGRLLKISASTIDRLLSEDKRRMRLKGRGGTKPGTLLRQQVPIRTFADWDEACPGFVEMDLVGHEGGLGRGDYA